MFSDRGRRRCAPCAARQLPLAVASAVVIGLVCYAWLLFMPRYFESYASLGGGGAAASDGCPRIASVLPRTMDVAEQAPFHMCVHAAGDLISDELMRRGYWTDCPSLAQLARAVVVVSSAADSAPVAVVDVGANIGSCALTLAATRGVGVVHAFEPVPANFELLRRSASFFPRGRAALQLYNNAVSDTANETVFFSVAAHNEGNSVDVGTHDTAGNNVFATTVRLDDVFAHHLADADGDARLSLMKIDVQGDELRVVRGAARLFDAGHFDVVRFEYSPLWLAQRGDSARALLDFFDERDYVLFEEDEWERHGFARPLSPHSFDEFARRISRQWTSYSVDVVAARAAFLRRQQQQQHS